VHIAIVLQLAIKDSTLLHTSILTICMNLKLIYSLQIFNDLKVNYFQNFCNFTSVM
jgi:hypothetical protein